MATIDDAFSFHAHVRGRVLPALARLDGLEAELDRVLAFYDALAARDLDFDLRQGPPWPSNLCEQDCALELAYTFGGRDTCGVRYSYEPTCKKSFLKPRHALCRDRLKAAMRLAGDDGDDGDDGYDVEKFLELFHLGVPPDVQLAISGDATACIAAIHHYKGRAPRLKAYFSVDYVDVARSLDVTRGLVGALHDRGRSEQLEVFLEKWGPERGVRMVGFDFEPQRPLEAKVYRQGAGLDGHGLDELIAFAGGGSAARDGVRTFQDLLLDKDRDPARFNLVTLAPSSEHPPRLKLYIRPVELYDDAEALERLRRWYRALGCDDELASAEQGLAAVAPLDVLSRTRGFFNYLSVDVGPEGVTKTSIYFAPLLPLMWLAREEPERLKQLAAAGQRFG